MSLTPATPKQFRYAILSAKNFDDPSFLAEQIGGNVANIGHIYTNGANRLVEDYARSNGIPCTVYPLEGSNLLTSTHLILNESDAAYIIEAEGSKSAGQIKTMCEEKGIGYKLFPFEPCSHWKLKVCRAQEILAALPEELENEWAGTVAALRKVL